MNLKISTQLKSVRACLKIAENPDYKPIWTSAPPADFRTLIAELAAETDAVTARAALADAATAGTMDAKAAAESALEESTFVLARALAVHFRRTGDFERRGKVEISRSELIKLRNEDLVNRATAIRDLAAAVVGETGADNRGITAERVEAQSRALDAFREASPGPRGQIANRGAILREVEVAMAGLMQTLDDLDDLILQFGDTAAGRRFIDAWRRARTLVDPGGTPNAPGSEDEPSETVPGATPRPAPVAQA